LTSEQRTQVLIVGGGTGGVAAALACAARGVSCVVAEPTAWVGGQLTSQAVPADENQWVETVGATRRYQEFRDRVRGWYRANRRLNPEALAATALNPGGGWVSRLCIEPRIAHEVLMEMLRPFEQAGVVTVRTGWTPTGADVDGDHVRSVTFKDDAGGAHTVSAGVVLDATELGDLYPMCGIGHAIGAEGKAAFGELHAPDGPDDPIDQQAFSWCFAMEHRPGENHRIAKPSRYDWWRAYVPEMTPKWPGPLFSWVVPSHNEEGRREFGLVPWPDLPREGTRELWRYRRIVESAIHADSALHPDVSLVNWVQMDYWLKPLLGVSAAEAASALAEAREQSRCLLYWMQTDAPTHEGGTGYPGLKLRGDELGTDDGFAMAPYIREPRRLKARTIVHEGHIGSDQRVAEGRPKQDASPFGCAEAFTDSVGIGHYTLDLHPSTSGRNSVYVPAAPFRIPMGALIPTRVRNVLAAGKAIGVTHITNGCYRMHTVEWNVGESAGALAAKCVLEKTEPHAVHASAEAVEEFQRELVAAGVRISWPWE